MPTFIIDCPQCKAKVAANEEGRAERKYWEGPDGDVEPIGCRIHVGSCPNCRGLLAGMSTQVAFEGYDSDEDQWSDIVRVHPKPVRTFRSSRVPRVVTESLAEADICMQGNANIAACAMLGRVLEAVCRNILEPSPDPSIGDFPEIDVKAAVDSMAPSSPEIPPVSARKSPRSRIMLAEGLRKLNEKGIIDARLYEWSKQLHAFRNLAAHAEDVPISREDAEDLQTFVYAIVEYIYDLTDRYNEFKARSDKRANRQKF